MPYPSNADLPEPLRRVLPEHAQDIYRAAFNKAWQDRRGEGDEAVLHRIAWGAVKRLYRKWGDRWVPKKG
ncbi:MAG: ChaB family protein [Acetobacteraceae bacterium]|nr:ChaB family protein [Acetobacteraceae bacterium]